MRTETNSKGKTMKEKLVAVKGSDIGRTVDISALAAELNDHPNGGFIFISKYESAEGVVTDQYLRLCPTNEQNGAGYVAAKAHDLELVNAAIDAIHSGKNPSFGSKLRIRRGAKLAAFGHKDFIAGGPAVEVSANTKKNCTGILQLDYSVESNSPLILAALLDIQRSIVAPRQTGLADYGTEGKGLFSLDKDGVQSFYIREVYHHFSCESKDENGVVIAGYKEKTQTEPAAIKDAIGKALNLRRDKYRAFKLRPGGFDRLCMAKTIITMDGRGDEFSVIDIPELARDWLGVSVSAEQRDSLREQVGV